jgi:iron complex outermembrane receptor protein
VKGFEAGVKGLFLDGTLRANLAAYDYKITGQQVTITIATAQFTSNAASSRSKGVEFDANWRAPIDGLSLRGGAAYNEAQYKSYTSSPCYAGQTVALGCHIVGGVPVQDLSGRPIARAPKWGVFMGGTYEIVDPQGRTWGVSTDANYTSSYFSDATNKPAALQQGYWLLDASAYVQNGPWKFSLVGRNLADTFYSARTIDAIFSGATNATRTQGVLADTIGSVSRGREVWLRASYTFK